MTTSVKRSALLPFSSAAVFEIVNDVARYPEFLPGCVAARVIQQSPGEVLASLSLRARGISESVTTRNLLTPHEKIELELVSGPLRALTGCWEFTRLGDRGCRVELNLEFQLMGLQAAFGALLGRPVAGVVSRLADQLVDAFCARASALLG